MDLFAKKKKNNILGEIKQHKERYLYVKSVLVLF